MISWLKYLSIAAIPGLMLCIAPAPGMPFRLSWQLASLVLGALAFTALLGSWWLRAFWLCVIAAAAFHVPPVYDAWIQLVSVAVFLAAAEGFRRIDTASVMHAFRVAGLLLSGWIILQQAGVLTLWMTTASGPFNSNLAGMFLALCLPAFFRRPWWPGVVPVVWGIVVAGSTTAALAAMMAVTVYAVMRFGRRAAVSSIVLLIIFSAGWALYIDDPRSIARCARWVVWEQAARSIQAEPLGRGLGSWSSLYPSIVASDERLNFPFELDNGQAGMVVFMQAHNEYVQTVFEMGVHTGALVVLFLAWSMWRAWRRQVSPRVAAGLAVLAVGSCGVFVFHVAPTALLGAAWVGAWLKTAENARRRIFYSGLVYRSHRGQENRSWGILGRQGGNNG